MHIDLTGHKSAESVMAEVERRLAEAERRVQFLEEWVLPSEPPADPEAPLPWPELVGNAHAAETLARWESFEPKPLSLEVTPW